MKLLQINAVYGFGSTGKIVEALDNIARRYGIDSYIAYAYGKCYQKSYKIGNRISHSIHALLCRITGKQGYYSILDTILLIRKIKQIHPDIVHLHNLHSNYINIDLLFNYLSKNRIKTVITQHDCWLYTGKCFHYTAIRCDKWISGCESCPQKMFDVPSYLLDSSKKVWTDKKRLFDSIANLTVVNVSNWLTNETSKSILNKHKIITIHNGINLDIFKPVKSDLRSKWRVEDKFVIIGMANKWIKNMQIINRIIDAFGEEIVFVLVGCKEIEYDFPKQVIRLGYVYDPYELAKIYSAGDVFANVSLEDTLGLVNIESQACGTPVISYRSTGLVETLSDKTGILIAPGNVDLYIDAINTVKQKGKRFYSKQCRAFVEEFFDQEKCYSQYIKLYFEEG